MKWKLSRQNIRRDCTNISALIGRCHCTISAMVWKLRTGQRTPQQYQCQSVLYCYTMFSHIRLTHLLQLKPNPVEESQPVGLGTFSRIHCLISLCHTGSTEERSVIAKYYITFTWHLALLICLSLMLVNKLASYYANVKLTIFAVFVLPDLFCVCDYKFCNLVGERKSIHVICAPALLFCFPLSFPLSTYGKYFDR